MGEVTAEWHRLMIEICPYRVGQRVKVSPDCKYASEWPDEYVITGIRWDYRDGSSVNISIAHDDEIIKRYGDTDGFRPHDLLPAQC